MLSSEDFSDIRIANFVKKVGEECEWAPHTKKKIMAAFNGLFKIIIPPLGNIYKYPEEWPKTTRVIMAK